MKSLYYQRTYELLLIESMLSQGYSEDQINEAFIKNISGFAGAPLGYLKRAIGSREDFAHNYNSVIDRSNALRRSRGQPTLKYWGGKETWDKPKVETTPDKTPDISPEEPKPKPLSKPIVGRDASKTLGGDKGSIDVKPKPKGFDFGARSSVPSMSTAGINTNPMLMRSVYAPTPKPSTPVTGDDASKVLGPQPPAPIGGVNTKFKAGGLTKTFLPKPAPSSFTAGIDPSKIGSEYGINPYQPKETKKQRIANRSAARRNKTRPATSPTSLRSYDRYQRRMKNYQQQTSSTYYGDIAKLIRESFQINEKKGPCWKGYEAVGMKMKGGRKVPNCVPKKK